MKSNKVEELPQQTVLITQTPQPNGRTTFSVEVKGTIDSLVLLGMLEMAKQDVIKQIQKTNP